MELIGDPPTPQQNQARDLGCSGMIGTNRVGTLHNQRLMLGNLQPEAEVADQARQDLLMQ